MLLRKENHRADSGGALGPGPLGRRVEEAGGCSMKESVNLLEKEKFEYKLGEEQIHQSDAWEEQSKPR